MKAGSKILRHPPIDQEGAVTSNYHVTPPKNPRMTPTSYPHLPEPLNLRMGMPQRKVPEFDDNPLNYWKFLRGFVGGVAQYVTNPADRLDFLSMHANVKQERPSITVQYSSRNTATQKPGRYWVAGSVTPRLLQDNTLRLSQPGNPSGRTTPARYSS
ncbi:hypothetical protein T265_00990 [Opisthorchis viverrini]|uniref:Uncharacterized protein n=1 Tax=Opisthorchis viverrini TaxID=6198 RepID=A0A075AB96_OPIVI|nr:hypothetical protein T265_00990 [Opisthorchis viverrini]KER33095.1 hypothetical protein T265_00990 [Opisthorchis viverrini]